MKKQKLILISFFFLLFNNIPSVSSDHNYFLISGKAKIIDGDTLKINNKKIRFSGIDAPESYFFGKKQLCILNNVEILCGILSKKKLKKKIVKSFVNCLLEKNKDRNKRYVGECYINKESLSVYMVRSGFAFDYPKYSNGKYKKDQEFAKFYSLGLWNMKFEYPWIWRKKNR